MAGLRPRQAAQARRCGRSHLGEDKVSLSRIAILKEVGHGIVPTDDWLQHGVAFAHPQRLLDKPR